MVLFFPKKVKVAEHSQTISEAHCCILQGDTLSIQFAQLYLLICRHVLESAVLIFFFLYCTESKRFNIYFAFLKYLCRW